MIFLKYIRQRRVHSSPIYTQRTCNIIFEIGLNINKCTTQMSILATWSYIRIFVAAERASYLVDIRKIIVERNTLVIASLLIM